MLKGAGNVNGLKTEVDGGEEERRREQSQRTDEMRSGVVTRIRGSRQ
jgi:hypothetical protein